MFAYGFEWIFHRFYLPKPPQNNNIFTHFSKTLISWKSWFRLDEITIFHVWSLQKSLQNWVKNAFEKKWSQNQLLGGFLIYFGRLFGTKFGQKRIKISIEFLMPKYLRPHARTVRLGGPRTTPQLKLLERILVGWIKQSDLVAWRTLLKSVRAHCLRLRAPPRPTGDQRSEIAGHKLWPNVIWRAWGRGHVQDDLKIFRKFWNNWHFEMQAVNCWKFV